MNVIPQKRHKKQTRRNGKRTRFSPFLLPPPTTCVTLTDPCPEQMRLPMRYTQDIDLSGAVIVDQVFNLNSIFDPDRTGAGHQPYGYDAWNNFYNRYRVDSVQFDVHVVNSSSAQVADMVVIASNDAVALTTQTLFDSAIEAPNSYRTLLSTSGGNNIWKFSRLFHLNRITGVTEGKYSDDDIYAAQLGASPSEVIVIHICAKDFAFAGTLAVKARCTLTYYVTLFDKFQLGQS
jgi:hypothetical protein